MNLKHGFHSNNTAVNPDCRHAGQAETTLPDLCFAERFLHGEACSDPVKAHAIVKAIHAAGKLKYPTLWDRANQYVNGYEFSAMEKISLL